MPRKGWKSVCTNVDEYEHSRLMRMARFLWKNGYIDKPSVSQLLKFSIGLMLVILDVAQKNKERYSRQFGDLLKAAFHEMRAQFAKG